VAFPAVRVTAAMVAAMVVAPPALAMVDRAVLPVVLPVQAWLRPARPRRCHPAALVSATVSL
jgi:hypothetical protein